MQSAVWVVGTWLAFAVSHVVLSTTRIRGALVRRLGERGFVWLFVLIASVTFTALVATYSEMRWSGPPGIGLARVDGAKTPLVVAIVAGFVLMAGALSPKGYWDSPSAIFMGGVRSASGLERVTRHPFFAGTVLVMGAHALLATRLTGTIFFAGFVALALLGSAHQARKLLAKKGDDYARYLESTSAIPFVAVLRGRQRVVVRELPWFAFALGLLTAWVVWRWHDGIFAWHGAPLIVVAVGGSVVIGVVNAWRSRARGSGLPD